jgi:CrcB protein
MLRKQLDRHGEAVALVAVGGLVGANLRYAIGATAGDALLITLLVNTAGSFGLGVLLFDARADEFLAKRVRYLVGTGFFAAFTENEGESLALQRGDESDNSLQQPRTSGRVF